MERNREQTPLIHQHYFTECELIKDQDSGWAGERLELTSEHDSEKFSTVGMSQWAPGRMSRLPLLVIYPSLSQTFVTLQPLCENTQKWVGGLVWRDRSQATEWGKIQWIHWIHWATHGLRKRGSNYGHCKGQSVSRNLEDLRSPG